MLTVMNEILFYNVLRALTLNFITLASISYAFHQTIDLLSTQFQLNQMGTVGLIR